MSRETINLTNELYQYVLENTLREDDSLRELRDRTATMEVASMQISPEQGQFMALLVQLLGAKRIVEVGVFTGYSSLCMARALPQDGQLIACDVSEEWTSIARSYWERAGVADKIDLRLAPAIETLQTLIDIGEGGSFDIAFIDADKESYDAYYEACLALLRRNGLIMIDNTLWSGRVADPDASDPDTDALRKLNAKIHQDERVDQILLPLADGLTLVRRR